MLYNMEISKQPSGKTVSQTVSTEAIDAFYKNDSNFSGVTVRVPDGVTRIRPYLFNDCWPDKPFNVILPDSVTEIMDKAFANCDIDNLYLSKNIKSLPAHTFDDCGLKTLHIYHSTSVTGYPWSYEDIDFKIVYLD